MKVKIGDKIYDANDQPIMIIISNEEKKLIASMPDDSYKYCAYPDSDDYTPEMIEEWMDAVEE